MKAAPTVLVVDSDRDSLAALQIALAFEGYRITSCRTTKEAIRYASRSCVDAVVTEIRLNGSVEAGFDFLAALRILMPQVPIVITSNQWDAELEERVRSMGIRALLKKPMELRLLRRTLKTALMAASTAFSSP